MSPAPAVSVVCATYRRPAAVRRLLTALAAQDIGLPFEVILSDDGSGPDHVSELRAAVADSPLEITLIENAVNRGAGATRNVGWRASAADVVAFTDDDCQPEPSWLRRGLEAMSDGGSVVVGRVAPDPAQTDALGPWSRSLTVNHERHFQTANAFYLRADLDAVDGFDERFRGAAGEDTDLGLRVVGLGRTSRFAADALVYHDVRAGTVKELARERATKWVDLPLVLRKHPEQRDTLLYRKWFWKQSHPPVILALLGIAAAPWVRTRSASAADLLLLLPWLIDRGIVHPPATGLRWRLRRMPGAFLVDSAEVVSLVRGSIRHRTVVL